MRYILSFALLVATIASNLLIAAATSSIISPTTLRFNMNLLHSSLLQLAGSHHLTKQQETSLPKTRLGGYVNLNGARFEAAGEGKVIERALGEDYFYHDPQNQLYIVCDGTGQTKAAFFENVDSHAEKVLLEQQLDGLLSPREIVTLFLKELPESLIKAEKNKEKIQEVFENFHKKYQARSFGNSASFVIARIIDNELLTIDLGDSEIWLYDTMGNGKKLSIENKPSKAILGDSFRAANINIATHTLTPQDQLLLLFSDGLTRLFSTKKIVDGKEKEVFDAAKFYKDWTQQLAQYPPTVSHQLRTPLEMVAKPKFNQEKARAKKATETEQRGSLNKIDDTTVIAVLLQ